SGGDPNTYTPTTDSTNINTTTLQNNLNSANIVSTTGSTGTQNGDITVTNLLDWATSNSLTLNAARDININTAINLSASGKILNLVAGGNITESNAIDGAITLNATAASAATFGTIGSTVALTGVNLCGSSVTFNGGTYNTGS